jgi:hypothetical protein
MLDRHATSTYLHEAAIAFGLLSPEDWWSYAVLVMQQQETFFDIPSENLSSVQIRKKLVGRTLRTTCIELKLIYRSPFARIDFASSITSQLPRRTCSSSPLERTDKTLVRARRCSICSRQRTVRTEGTARRISSSTTVRLRFLPRLCIFELPFDRQPNSTQPML